MKKCLKFDTKDWEPSRKRLYRQYRHFQSFARVAIARQVNVRYVYDYIVNNIKPKNKIVCKALGISTKLPVTINQLLRRSIQEMPEPILKLALKNRYEI
jgi:hypothetical protein